MGVVWEVGTGRAYQVMHNCRRNIVTVATVNATGDPYIKPPADQPSSRTRLVCTAVRGPRMGQDYWHGCGFVTISGWRLSCFQQR